MEGDALLHDNMYVIDSVLPVFKTTKFITSIIITIIFCVGANVGINCLLYPSGKMYPYWNSGGIILSILIVCILMSVIAVLGTGDVRKAVLAGKVPGIRRSALGRGLWRFLPLDINDWRDRLSMFVVMAIALPGTFTVLVIYVMCAATSEGFPTTQADCNVTRWDMVIYSTASTTFITLFLMTMNFAAACNIEQPELAPGWKPYVMTPRQKKGCCALLIVFFPLLGVSAWMAILMFGNTKLTFDPPPGSMTQSTDDFLTKFTNLAPAPTFILIDSLNGTAITQYASTLQPWSQRLYNLSVGDPTYGPNVHDIQGYWLSSEFLKGLFVSPDNRTTLVSINYHTPDDIIGEKFSLWLADQLNNPYFQLNDTNLVMKLTGLGFLVNDITTATGSDFIRIDMVALPIAICVLAYCLKSIRILFVPLLNLPLSMALSFATVLPLTYAMDVSSFTPDMMAAMISALNIDYTLFLVSRFYEQIDAHQLQDITDPEIQYTIVRRTTQLAAHNILVSGVTIALANAGIAVFPMDMLRTIGIGCCLAILCTVAVNMTVTPLLLFVFFDYFSKQMVTPKLLQRALTGISEGTRSLKRSISLGGTMKTVQGESAPTKSLNRSSGLNRSYSSTSSFTNDADEKSKTLRSREDIHADAYHRQMSSPWFRIARWTVKHPIPIVILVTAVGVPFFYMVPKMKVTFDLFSQVPRNAPHLAPFREISSKFGGGKTTPYFIPVDSGFSGNVPGGLQTNDFFNTLRDVQNNINNQWGQAGLIFTSIAQVSTPLGLVNVTWNESYYPGQSLSCVTLALTLSAQCLLNETATESILPPAIAKGYRYLWNQSVTQDNRSTIMQLFTPFAPMGSDAVPFLDKVMPYLHTYKDDRIAFIGMSGGASDSWAVMQYIMQWFPYQIIATFGVIFLFIAVAFRSIAVPVRMLFTVGYTVAFTYGFAVLVFQYTWLDQIWTALQGVDGLFWIIPVQCFTVICGLALDYDVFLLSRVVEYRKKGFTDSAAMCKAVYKTGRIISFAGMIMAIAFSSLIFSEIMVMNQSGLMLGIAVILDTFIIRTLSTPALMSLAPRYVFWPSMNEAGTRDYDDMGEDEDVDEPWAPVLEKSGQI